MLPNSFRFVGAGCRAVSVRVFPGNDFRGLGWDAQDMRGIRPCAQLKPRLNVPPARPFATGLTWDPLFTAAGCGSDAPRRGASESIAAQRHENQCPAVPCRCSAACL